MLLLKNNIRLYSIYINHSHKKRKDSLETRVALLIFSLELEISGVAVQRIHQNNGKWWLCEELLNENDFEAVLATFCCFVMTMEPTLLRQFLRSLQIKKITNALRVLYSLLNS